MEKGSVVCVGGIFGAAAGVWGGVGRGRADYRVTPARARCLGIAVAGVRTSAVEGQDSDPMAALAFHNRLREVKPDTAWKWHPWGLFVIAAAGLKLIGQTTLAARLPFALAGLATVVLLFLLARRYFGATVAVF